jgi:transcriptional regulator with XRE-family HTH domain
MTLLRRVLGESLRGQRLRQRRTLREVSGAARVSLGYLSEVERGQKEASSELLASICNALDVRMSDLLREVSETMRRSERATEVARLGNRTLVPAGAGARGGDDLPSRPQVPTQTRGVDRLPVADQAPETELSASILDKVLDAAPLAEVDLDAELVGPLQGLEQARFDRVSLNGSQLDGVDLAGVDLRGVDLDGVDLAELETGDGLGEVEVLLGLTDLLYRPDHRRGELAGARAS